MTFFAESYATREEFQDGPPVHDPVAVFALVQEYELSSKEGMVSKDLRLHCIEEGPEEGNFEYEEDEIKGSKVVFEINTPLFWKLFLESLERADAFIVSQTSQE